tara:strand:- start:848 stop:1402 length:555 start_codon:yes stop_codon:yes gene_type:complete
MATPQDKKTGLYPDYSDSTYAHLDITTENNILGYEQYGSGWQPGDGLINFFLGEDNFARGGRKDLLLRPKDGDNVYNQIVDWAKEKSFISDAAKDNLLRLSEPIESRREFDAFKDEYGWGMTTGNVAQAALTNWAAPGKAITAGVGALARKFPKLAKGTKWTGGLGLGGYGSFRLLDWYNEGGE